jgi:thiamine pyrophosphate-dependent acetolactate synthase large subunit-like protein
MTSSNESYLTARQKKAQAAKRAKQRQQEKEQAHLSKLEGLIGKWMKETSTVITDEQTHQQPTTKEGLSK